MEGWQIGVLGELCQISIGGTPTRNNSEYWDSEKSTENLWVSIRDMNQKFISETAEYITDLGVKKSNVKPQYPGAILLSFKLTIGRVAFVERKLYTNEAIAALYSEKLDLCFLYYGLQQWNLLQDVDQAIKGATLNKAKLNKIEFEYPICLEEQKQIASVLSTIDQAIAQTEAIIAKQQRIKTGLMQDLLTKGIDEAGNVRSEETHEFKDSAIGRIPVEWEVELIASVLTQPPKNGYSPSEADDWNGAYMLGLGCLTSEGFKPRQFKYAPLENRLFKSALLRDGDFLISRSNTRTLVGLVGIFKDVGETCIYPDLMMRLCFSNAVSTDYMEQVFMSLNMRRQIENLASGTSDSMVKINTTGVKKLLFRKPSLHEQIRIFEFLKLSTEEIFQTTQQLKKLHSLKTGLMQDLLTGKVPVTDLLDPNPPP